MNKQADDELDVNTKAVASIVEYAFLCNMALIEMFNTFHRACDPLLQWWNDLPQEMKDYFLELSKQREGGEGE